MMEQTEQKLGNYRLVKRIGQGGFANVYLGEHIYLKTQAAIKVLQLQLTPEVLETFLTEARLIAHLAHPNIVRVLEFGIEQETPFLVMSYAPYGSLRELHSAGSVVPISALSQYVRQLSQALQYAHDRNIVHRDVKPENMLLMDDHTVMLSDFGIAVGEQNRQHTQAGRGVIGTSFYMAPEQFHGQYSPASDQYALAVVVYEWLCGVPPFVGSPTEVAIQHIRSPLPSLRARMPALPITLEHVIERALSKDPQTRFPSIQDFASAFEEACAMLPTRTSNLKPLHMSLPSKAAQPSPEYHSSATVAGPFYSGTLPPPSTTPLPPSTSPQRQISRRAVVGGLAGLTLGGLALAGLSTVFRSQSQTANSTPAVHIKKKPTPKTQPTAKPNATATAQVAVINGVPTRPAVTSWGTGRLDIFARGSDNALWHRAFDNGHWAAWESLGGSLAYDPVATSWGRGRLDIFVRGGDNSFQHMWYDGTWHAWETLDGILTADPAVTSPLQGVIDVCVNSVAGAVFYRRFTGVWNAWTAMGGVASAAPAISSWRTGQIDLFVRGTDNHLWQRHFENTWRDWTPISQDTFTSGPTVASWAPGRLDVFINAADSSVRHNWFDGTWHDWSFIAGALGSAPTAASWGVNRLDLFARSTSNILQQAAYDGSWHDWTPLP